MIIFKDIITDDELISDAYKMQDKGVIFEVDAKRVTKGADNIQLEGANPSAEEADEGTEDTSTTVIDVADSFRLSPVEFDKKAYTSAVKSYMKCVVTKLKEAGKSEDEIKEFQTGAQAAAKTILANFKDYETYTGESMNPDGMIVLLNYREDGITPYFTFWKHGLKEMKI
ncbi:TPA_exp: TCTP family protein [Trichophyton benhamiae CBS 112371]|uniref:Translationally-controlled tumor protein homolog n=2 Tax=Trichophyton TaxID=5550 RepID=D4B1C0_ARTBC|nr:TCTP family protein [Trichophyton benhamiae CBS 112371]EFE31055.1 TCTP family protein [Trichophyton benhamiae CBS 112371]DAA74241.1 TPA_exp: TCTP family protein [Trichophyton benhamiae CBS 112371]